MEKHILIAIDGSRASMAAVKYLGFILGKNAPVKVDVLHVLPDIPPLFLEPGESMVEMAQLQDFAERMQDENRQKAAHIMEEAKAVMTGAGVDPERINLVVKEPSFRVARDILDLEEEGGYDAIVMGRHGMSAVEEFFMGSVTHKVLQHAKDVSLCIVHGETDSRRLLVPIVSSANSKRVLDQVAWLVGQGGPVEVTLLHLVAPLIATEMTSAWTGLAEMESTVEQRWLQDAEEMLSQATTYLTERGVPAFAIKTRLESRVTGVARFILKEAREGGYGSIMIGRRGISRAERFLFGSVSNKVVQQARDVAVWVVS